MTSKFAIETSEYEQKRHLFDMYRWINEKLAQLEKERSPGTIYFERKGTNVKKLIEEAQPACCLGLYFLRPADDIYISNALQEISLLMPFLRYEVGVTYL